MRKTKPLLYSLLVLAALPSLSFAHGSVINPASRAYICNAENPWGPEEFRSPACLKAEELGRLPPNFDGKQAMVDWFEINQADAADNHQAVVPNGTLCAGGKEKYRGFNQAKADWWTSTDITPDANGEYEFTYHAHAPHKTFYFRFYVTKDGWDQTQPLAWKNKPGENFAELEEKPFAEFYGDAQGEIPEKIGDGSTQKFYKEVVNGMTFYKMKAKLPANKTGPHIIYNVWQRPLTTTPWPGLTDSDEAFYSCSDVNFVPRTGTLTNPLFNNPWK